MLSSNVKQLIGMIIIAGIGLAIIIFYIILTIIRDSKRLELNDSINIDFQSIDKAVLLQNVELQKTITKVKAENQYLKEKIEQTSLIKVDNLPSVDKSVIEGKTIGKFVLIFLVCAVIVTLIVLLIVNPFAENTVILENIKYVIR